MEQKTAILIVIVAVIAVGIVLVFNPQLLGKASGTTGNTPETNPAIGYACYSTCADSDCTITESDCRSAKLANGSWTCTGDCECRAGNGEHCGLLGSCGCELREIIPKPKKEEKPN